MESHLPTVLPPNTEEVIRESNAVLVLAESLTVTDEASYMEVGSLIVAWKDKIKQREAFFKPIKQAIDASKQVVLDKEKEAVNPLKAAIQIVEPRAMKWKRDEDERAEVERRRLEDEARKREEEARLAEAVNLERAGEIEQARQIISEPIEIPRIAAPAFVPKVQGLGTQKRWTFEIVDANKITRPYLCPDEGKIRKQVLAIGKDAEKLVGGIRVFQEESFKRARG